MKKITLILMLFALPYMAFGQCPTEEYITFYSQQEIDDFAINYPNCTEIQGSLSIQDSDPIYYLDSDITNLNGLSQISVIYGDLAIGSYYLHYSNPLLNDLTGLSNLTTIGGSLVVASSNSLTDLTALSGLNNLGGGLYLHDMSITDLSGLEGLNSVHRLSLIHLGNLTDLSGLSGLNIIENGVLLAGLNNITDLSGLNNPLIKGSITIGFDDYVYYDDPLCELIYGDDILNFPGACDVEPYLAGNNNFVSLNGINNLDSITSLNIRYNNSLSVCNSPFICNYLQSGGNADIYDNASGCNSAAEIIMSCEPDCPQGTVFFYTQQQIDDFAINYPNCTEIQGNLSLSGTNIMNLQGLSNITTITGSLWMTGSSGWSGYNPFLINNLVGLENLTTVGGDMTLGLADNLTDMTGLNNLSTIGGKLRIGYYAYGVDTSDPSYEAGNASLVSLNGLDNLSSISDLEIAYNANLSTCNDPFICNYLQNGGQSDIYDNASGCNSTAEILNSCTFVPVCTEQDSLALVALYNATNGANWTNTWNLNTPINTWHGVTMSADACNVLELNLSNNNLVGTIPAEIGELSVLTRLLLHTNQLSGVIPPEIANASELRQIWLFNNQLSGTLPTEIGTLGELTHLGIGGNQLTGSIPATYGDLSNLGFIALKNNDLSGCFDDNLSNICAAGTNARINSGNNLDALWTNFCTTEAGVCTPPPAPTCRYTDSLALLTLFQATNGPTWTTTWNPAQPMDAWYGITLNAEGCVAEVNLAQNNLFGILPSAIGNLMSMVRFNVHSNRLMGGIPAAIGNAVELRQIWVFNNELTGPLPEEIGNLIHLTHLGAGKNQLEGTIPTSYGNLSNLILLTVPQNQLSGCFDDNLANICSAAGNSNINSGNNFDALWSDFCTTGAGSCTGTPPLTCRYLDSLILIDLYDATNGLGWATQWNISQPIDIWYGVTLNANGCVQELNIPNNNLTGTIPTSIGNLAALERLNLHTNSLSATIPATIGNLSALHQLWLFSNQLSGTLPPQIGNLTNLTHLGIGNNQFTGSIPASYGNLSNLGFLALKNNNLTGCYDANLANICAAGNDSRISSGNNFSASWSAFCTNLTGCCNCRLDMSNNLVESEETLINLYPNPANQFINIEIQTKSDNQSNYMIYNALGEIVQSGQIQGQAGTHAYPIELNGLNTGVYYLSLMIENKQTAKHFTVIQ